MKIWFWPPRELLASSYSQYLLFQNYDTLFPYSAANGLSGTLPDELQGLDVLLFLQLPQKNLRGGTLLEAMTNTFSYKYSGSDPFLISLVLFSNQLEGPLSPSIRRFSTLTQFYITDNLLTGTVPEVVRSLQIIGFFAGNNLLSGQIPETIYDIANVLVFDFSSNVLLGTIPKINAAIPSPQNFFLGNNLLYGTIPDSLRYAEKALTMDVSENALTGTLPSGLGVLVHEN